MQTIFLPAFLFVFSSLKCILPLNPINLNKWYVLQSIGRISNRSQPIDSTIRFICLFNLRFVFCVRSIVKCKRATNCHRKFILCDRFFLLLCTTVKTQQIAHSHSYIHFHTYLFSRLYEKYGKFDFAFDLIFAFCHFLN